MVDVHDHGNLHTGHETLHPANLARCFISGSGGIARLPNLSTSITIGSLTKRWRIRRRA